MKPRVLVVDDEQTIVVGLTALLALNDIESAGAFDRLSAEAMMTGTFYSVILADIRLHTEAEGLELLEDIQRLSPQSRVLSMTGYATPELEREVRARGSLSVIRKPASSGQIVGAIADMLAEIENLAAEQAVLDLAQLQVHMRKILFSIAQRRYGLMVEEAEDVVQEAWLLFLERRGIIRSARGWLAGTVANLCRRHIDRSVRTRKRFVEDDGIENTADGHAGDPEAGIAVRQAMAGLDATSRALCTLIAIEGYAYEEVSSRTGLPLGSIGPMYMRAKKKLRLALEQNAPRDQRRALAA
ncbi:MAG: sigma-70 family RNA polymerase sigma factor [Thermoanaerobaculia bacterium]